MSAHKDKLQTKHVSREELEAGVTLRAGHPVHLLVGGVPGAPDEPWDDGDEGATGATGPVEPGDPTGPPGEQGTGDEGGDEGQHTGAVDEGDEGATGEPPTPHPGREIAAHVLDVAGAPAKEVFFEITFGDGTKTSGKTDADGALSVASPVHEAAKLVFPDVDANAPAKAGLAPADGSLPYQKGGVPLQPGTPATVRLPQRVLRARLTGLHFETDKSFLLPTAVPHLRELARLYAQHPGLQVLVSGHADRAGNPQHNLLLSVERAESIAAFLQDQVDGWTKLYGADRPSGLGWGTREDQYMLATLTDADGPFYTGLVDGAGGPKTEGALKKFQTWSNANKGTSLAVDGKAGAETRKALVTAYMALPETSLPAGTTVLTHGCGETHPEVDTLPKTANAENRRVEIYLFDGPVTPPPQTPCPGACPEYPQWKNAAGETIDLEHAMGALSVAVRGPDDALLEGASVHVTGPVSADGKTDAQGTVRFDELIEGHYKVFAQKEGFQAGEGEADVSVGAGAAGGVGATASFAGGPKGDPKTVITQVVLAVENAEYIVQLVDKSVSALASEETRAWADTECVFAIPGAPDLVIKPDATGLVKMNVQPTATPKAVRRTGPHAGPIVWTVDLPQTPALKVNTPVDVPITGRLRNSIWAFDDALSPLSNRGAAIDALQGVDDVRFVTTLSYTEDSKKPGVPDVKLTTKLGAQYYKDVYARLHAAGVQLILGFSLVEYHSSDTSPGGLFAKWFGTASEADVQAYAKAILDKLDSEGMPYDGLGLDIEIERLNLPGPKNAAHRPNMKTLVVTLAKALAKKDKLLTYATDFFRGDGSGNMWFLDILPLQLTLEAPNIIARPMAYLGQPQLFETEGGKVKKDGNGDPIKRPAAVVEAERKALRAGLPARHKALVEFALRKQSDKGAGLHPSQLQLGMNVVTSPTDAFDTMTVAEIEKTATSLLKPNRVGFIEFKLTLANTVTPAMAPNSVAQYKKYDAALNAKLPAQNSVGQPIHVPLQTVVK
ncbi:MAG: OmpA family protein [Deltaproteobacteria bacterium]|nr:OmpA family protein [Deltaproteobacteria bacterium]